MTTENAKAIKEKLDVISAAAQEYSNSAKMFDAAKENISTLADSNKEQSRKMQKLIKGCDDYLSLARNLIDTEFTNQLEVVTLKAKEVMDKNGEKCQEVVDSVSAIQKEVETKLNEFGNKLSKIEKQNKLFFYVCLALDSVIILLIILGFFI